MIICWYFPYFKKYIFELGRGKAKAKDPSGVSWKMMQHQNGKMAPIFPNSLTPKMQNGTNMPKWQNDKIASYQYPQSNAVSWGNVNNVLKLCRVFEPVSLLLSRLVSSPWLTLAHYGSFWLSLAHSGSLWLSVWLSLAFTGSPLVSPCRSGSLWLSVTPTMAPAGFIWLSVSLSLSLFVSLCLSMALCNSHSGSLKLFLALSGSLWLSVTPTLAPTGSHRHSLDYSGPLWLIIALQFRFYSQRVIWSAFATHAF